MDNRSLTDQCLEFLEITDVELVEMALFEYAPDLSYTRIETRTIDTMPIPAELGVPPVLSHVYLWRRIIAYEKEGLVYAKIIKLD